MEGGVSCSNHGKNSPLIFFPNVAWCGSSECIVVAWAWMQTSAWGSTSPPAPFSATAIHRPIFPPRCSSAIDGQPLSDWAAPKSSAFHTVRNISILIRTQEFTYINDTMRPICTRTHTRCWLRCRRRQAAVSGPRNQDCRSRPLWFSQQCHLVGGRAPCPCRQQLMGAQFEDDPVFTAPLPCESE